MEARLETELVPDGTGGVNPGVRARVGYGFFGNRWTGNVKPYLSFSEAGRRAVGLGMFESERTRVSLEGYDDAGREAGVRIELRVGR